MTWYFQPRDLAIRLYNNAKLQAQMKEFEFRKCQPLHPFLYSISTLLFSCTLLPRRYFFFLPIFLSLFHSHCITLWIFVEIVNDRACNNGPRNVYISKQTRHTLFVWQNAVVYASSNDLFHVSVKIGPYRLHLPCKAIFKYNILTHNSPHAILFHTLSSPQCLALYQQ